MNLRGRTLRDGFKESAIEAFKFRFALFVRLPEQAEDLVEHLPVRLLDRLDIHGDLVDATRSFLCKRWRRELLHAAK